MERNHSIDVVRFFAIFFIICLHVQPFENVHFLGMDVSYLNFIIVTFARFAVPFFFITSGYLLSEKIKSSQNPEQYFKKYITKNLKLYISWFLFYVVFDSIITIMKSHLAGENFTRSFVSQLGSYSIVKVVYAGTATTSYPLWFLLALLWSVIALFAFYKMNKITLLFVVSLALNLTGQLGQAYQNILQPPIFIYTKDALFFGLFYTTAGFYISSHYDFIKSKINISKNMLLLLFFALSLLQMVESLVLIAYFGAGKANYFITTIPLTICLLLFVLKSKGEIKNRIIIDIGQNAVGIFVTHTFIMTVILIIISLLHLKFILNNFFWHVIFTPLVFISSYVFYSVIQVIKAKFNNLKEYTGSVIKSKS